MQNIALEAHKKTLIDRLWRAADDRDIDETYRFVTELVALSTAATAAAYFVNLLT